MIIAVPDPFGRHDDKIETPLMLDDYVTVSIEGKTMKGVIELPRTALRDDNTVWVLDNGKLSIRHAGILWKQGERVFIDKGVDAGDAVISSPISIPVDGMRLSIVGSAKGENPSDRRTQKDINDDDV